MLTRDNLHGYQHISVEHIKKHRYAGLFLEMGLGKTVSTLTALADLKACLAIHRTIVVAPKAVALNVWAQELAKWEHLKELTCTIVAGDVRARRRKLREQTDIHVIGLGSWAWLCAEFGGSFLPYDVLVIDELSAFKAAGSLRFKASKKVLQSFERRIGLTGTPAAKGFEGLWAQMYMLDEGERLGERIGEYRTKYLTVAKRITAHKAVYKVTNGADARIFNKISDICISMKTRDYLDLPDMILNPVQVHLDEKTAAQYKEFKRENVLELFGAGEPITALSAAALSGKLLQFANGAVYDENKEVHEVHSAKIDKAVEIIEINTALGRNTLIAWAYKHDRDRLMERLAKYDPVAFVGSDSERLVKRWNAGDIKILLMHPASGGHGLNLQKGGRDLIWFGNTWSLERFQQLNTRLHRQGSVGQVTVTQLGTKGTVDERVLKSLTDNEEGQDALMSAIKAEVAEILANEN